MYATYWNDRDRARLLGKGESWNGTALPAWRTGYLRRCQQQADNPVDRMLWLDNRTYLPGALLDTPVDFDSLQRVGGVTAHHHDLIDAAIGCRGQDAVDEGPTLVRDHAFWAVRGEGHHAGA